MNERNNLQEVTMLNKALGAMRERQYKHFKENLEKHGKPQSLAEETAARVVNKECARQGEPIQASAFSLKDISSGRRGGLRSYRGPGGCIFLHAQ